MQPNLKQLPKKEKAFTKIQSNKRHHEKNQESIVRTFALYCVVRITIKDRVTEVERNAQQSANENAGRFYKNKSKYLIAGQWFLDDRLSFYCLSSCRMTLHKCKVMFGGWLDAYKQMERGASQSPKQPHCPTTAGNPCVFKNRDKCVSVCAHACILSLIF